MSTPTGTKPEGAEARARLRAEREALKNEYAALFATVSALMYEHDPIGINFGDNPDEYEPEAGTVIPRLESCRDATELTDVLHEEFCRWFDADTAGPRTRYEPLALAIWAATQSP
jgi:hypothetical protein